MPQGRRRGPPRESPRGGSTYYGRLDTSGARWQHAPPSRLSAESVARSAESAPRLVPRDSPPQYSPPQPRGGPARTASGVTSPMEPKGSESGVTGLVQTVHAAHSKQLEVRGRHKTYIVAVYTAELTQADVDQPWFVVDEANRDQQDARGWGLRLGQTNTRDDSVWGALGSSPNSGSSSRAPATPATPSVRSSEG